MQKLWGSFWKDVQRVFSPFWTQDLEPSPRLSVKCKASVGNPGMRNEGNSVVLSTMRVLQDFFFPKHWETLGENITDSFS